MDIAFLFSRPSTLCDLLALLGPILKEHSKDGVGARGMVMDVGLPVVSAPLTQ